MSVLPSMELATSLAGGDAAADGGLAAMPLADVPLSLLWAVGILTFALLLGFLVLMLLRRESESMVPWDVALGPGAKRGQYLQHLSRLLRAIRAINNIIVAERDAQRLLERACRSLTTTRGYRMAWIGFVEEGSKKVRPVAQAGFESGYLDEILVTWDDSPSGQGPTGRAIRTGEPSLMRDIETDPAFEPWRQQALQRGYRSSAALPLRLEGRVLGALNVYSDMPDAFDIEEIGLLQEVADHVAYALGSVRAHSQLTEVQREARRAEDLRAAFDHVPVGVLLTDREGVVTHANRRVVELLEGYRSPDQLVGVKMGDLHPFRARETRASIQDALGRGAAVQFQCEISAPEGRKRTLRCRGTPVMGDDKGSAAVWVIDEGPDRS